MPRGREKNLSIVAFLTAKEIQKDGGYLKPSESLEVFKAGQPAGKNMNE